MTAVVTDEKGALAWPEATQPVHGKMDQLPWGWGEHGQARGHVHTHTHLLPMRAHTHVQDGLT